MAEAATASSPAAAGAAKPERKVYRASGGRRTMFSFLLLILLPFFASLPAMLYMRVSQGLWFDTVGLGVIALAFSIIMFLLLVELMFSLRARVELGENKVKMTLPSGRGATPMLRYKSYEVPYDQVDTVETRREVYGGGLIPVQLQGARLILKDGTRVPLGYVSEANVDPAFPYPEIAKKIADRARLPLINRGSVRRSLRKKMFGKAPAASVDDTVSEAEIAGLNHTHSNFILGLIGIFAVLIVVGIVEDLSASGPAAQSVSAAPATPAKLPKTK